MITENELKKYAIIGILTRINAESSRLPKITDEETRKIAEYRLLKLKADYDEILTDLRREEGISL